MSKAPAPPPAAAATAPPTLYPKELSDALGPRLQPMMGVLATQPDELKEELIQRSCRILYTTASIKQRLETITRFEGT